MYLRVLFKANYKTRARESATVPPAGCSIRLNIVPFYLACCNLARKGGWEVEGKGGFNRHPRHRSNPQH